jgi:sec-independent protein translocase protein TatB
MFDIGFSEIVVIAVVALIVIGPEKLPKTARTLGLLFGRLQRYVNDVKSDISREIQLDELRKLQNEVQTAAREVETSVTSTVQQVESGLRGVESELNATATDPLADADHLPKENAAAAEMKPLSAPQDDVPLFDPAADAAAHKMYTPQETEPPRQGSLPGLDRG